MEIPPNIFETFYKIEEKFNKLSDKEKDKYLDNFMDNIFDFYKIIVILFNDENFKEKFNKSIDTFCQTKELRGITKLIFKLGKISIYTMEKSFSCLEKDEDFEQNDFDKETVKIFKNVLFNTKDLNKSIENILNSKDKIYSGYLQDKIDNTIKSWDICCSRIIETENLEIENIKNLSDTLEDAFNILEKVIR